MSFLPNGKTVSENRRSIRYGMIATALIAVILVCMCIPLSSADHISHSPSDFTNLPGNVPLPGNTSSNATHSGEHEYPPSNSDRPSASDHVSSMPSELPSGGNSNIPSQTTSGAGGDSSDIGSGDDVPSLPLEDGVTLQEGSAPEGYLDQVYFYGDSTTYGLRHYGVLGTENSSHIWTPKSGTLALFNATREKIYDPESGGELPLSEIAAKYTPSYLVITLGVNGISMMNETYFKGEYAKVIAVIREASPKTNIILQSMYPLSSAYHETKSLNQGKIQTGNRWILEIAQENGCRFLYSYPYFLDDNGYMDLKYENGGDGMHFNAAGYRRMLEYLLSHPYPAE